MTKDEILSMAKESGFMLQAESVKEQSDWWECFDEEIERFADLVAEKEREAIMNMMPGGFSVDPQWVCDAIRARGDK
jgi:hypothetical protein